LARQDSARISGSIELEVTAGSDAGHKVSMPFTGAIDNRAKTGSLSFDPSQLGAPGLGSNVEEIFAGNVVYMSLDAFPSSVRDQFGDKHWLKLDMSKYAGSSSQTQQSDPTSALDALRGVSNDVQDLGHASVRGVDTTHYRANIDLAKALVHLSTKQRARVQSALSQFGSTFPMDVWLDHDGVPRRYSITIDVTKAGSTGHLTEGFDFYDFGTPVSVKVPNADDVADFSQLQQIGQTTAAS
jgi:hypothetical protein